MNASRRAAVALLGILLFSSSLLFTQPSAQAAAEDKTVQLIVSVEDGQGNPVSMAHINVFQNLWGGETRVKWLAPVPSYQQDTGGNGLAPVEIKAKAGASLTLVIEVGREDMKTERRTIYLGKDYPSALPPEKFTIKKKLEDSAGPMLNVAIPVQDAEGNPVEGASVVIYDSFLGPSLGRFRGATGADGRATVPIVFGGGMLYRERTSEHQIELKVAKPGYKEQRKFHAVTQQDIGKTSVTAPVVLEKTAAGGAKVTVTVLDKSNKNGVGDATVILDGAGYHSDTTNSGGNVTLLVPEIGTFAVRVSQDTYESATSQIRLLPGEQEKALTVELEPKPKKDLGNDTIEVTVLAKDPTDEKSKPSPLGAAYVKAGTIGVATEKDGHATLKGAFEEKQNVSVEANGYKSQQQVVSVSKVLHYSEGSGSATFTLDPELSENSPIRLIVEVRGPDARGADSPIKGAVVGFISSTSQPLGGGHTEDNGERDFRSTNFPNVPLSQLRKGLLINVKAEGYKNVLNRSVPADLLRPSNEARRFTIQLEKDWSELAKAIRELEAHVAAWETDQHAAPSKDAESQFIDKALAARKGAEQGLKEIQAGKEAFGISLGPGDAATTRCRKAGELKEALQRYEADANQKAKDVSQQLDEASAVVSSCAKAEDAEHIRKNYRAAINLVFQIGKLEKKATNDRNDLSSLVQEGLALTKMLAEMETKLAAISDNLKTVEETEQKAGEQYRHYNDLLKSIAARLVGLKAELAVLEVKYEVDKSEIIPADLRKRIEVVRRKLDTSNVVGAISGEAKSMPKNIADAANVVRNIHADAEKVVSQYRAATCDIEKVDQIVEGIGTTLTNASFEIGLAANLPMDADVCAQKVADEVEVPDLGPFNDVGAMKHAADQAGMVLMPTAIDVKPPDGVKRMFAGQDPKPNTKSKRGGPLKIYIYQALAQKSPVPEASTTPGPSAVAAASPKPTTAGEEYVVVPSVAGAESIDYMRTILQQAGFKSAFHARKPPSKAEENKFAGQDPVGKIKKSDMEQRHNLVVVYINQKWESPESAQATPVEQDKKTGEMPSLIGLTLDQAVGRLTGKMRIGGDEVGDKPPTPEKALTIFSQEPPAGTKIDPDNATVVTVRRYGSAESSTSAEATPASADAAPASSATKMGTMPTLVGLTLSQAMRQLTTNMRIGGDETKEEPPTPEKAFTIFRQTPLAGTQVNLDQEVVVTVKRYGAAKATGQQPEEVVAQSTSGAQPQGQPAASATPYIFQFPPWKLIGEDRWVTPAPIVIQPRRKP